MESEAKQLRRHVIQHELREILNSAESDLPVSTDAVLVLSHAGLSAENTARTEFGVELVKKMTAQRLGLGNDIEITPEQISQSGPYYIIDGVSKRDTEKPETPCQNEDMRIIIYSGKGDITRYPRIQRSVK